jgi:putative redox protein
MGGTRTVEASWDGGLRCTVTSGRFQLIVDEPVAAGGTDSGPQPTELLLSSVASCLTLAIAFTARKRGIELGDLQVSVTGVYDGPRFVEINSAVRCDPEPANVERLLAAAERVCYVSNTLRTGPTLSVGVARRGRRTS